MVPEAPPQDRRMDDGRMAALVELMTTHHRSMVSTLEASRDHFDRRVDDLVSRFDSEIPEGHGAYHRKLIEEAARRQALQDAMKHKVLVWVFGAVLAALSAYASGIGDKLHKAWTALVK